MNENPFASPEFGFDRPKTADQHDSKLSFDTAAVIPLDGRRSWVAVSLYIKSAVSVLQIIINVMFIQMFLEIGAGNRPSRETAESMQFAASTGLGLGLLSGLFAAISFLSWIHRASKNLAPLGSRHQQYSPGWTIGCWFVPIASLVWPYQAVKEIWIESEPDLYANQSMQEATVPSLLSWWWGTWLVFVVATGIVNQVAGKMAEFSPSIIAGIFSLEAASLGVSVIAAMFAIKVVNQITDRQRLRLEKLDNLPRGAEAAPLPTALPRTNVPDFVS